MNLQKDFDDFEFVIQEIIRYKPKSIADARERLAKLKTASDLVRSDYLHQVRDPDHGHMTCGRLASRRILEIMKRQVEDDPNLVGRVSINNATKLFKDTVIKAIRSESQDIGPPWVAHYLAVLRRILRMRLKRRRYVVPCTMLENDEPEHFTIGPIEFMRRNVWLRQNENAIREANFGESTEHIVNDINEFTWIMIIPMEKCDPDVGRDRAHLAGIAALNILRLFVPRGAARYFGIMTAKAQRRRWSGLSFDDEGLNCQISLNWKPHLGDEWMQFISTPNWIRDNAAQAIIALTTDFDQLPLRQRFLDALYWYGEACIDESEAGVIVKVAAAIERLTITENSKGFRNKFARRGGYLCSLAPANFKSDNDLSTKGYLYRLYNCRSRLMHGSGSPMTLYEPFPSNDAIELARQAIVGALVFFANIKNGRGSAADLEASYMKNNID